MDSFKDSVKRSDNYQTALTIPRRLPPDPHPPLKTFDCLDRLTSSDFDSVLVTFIAVSLLLFFPSCLTICFVFSSFFCALFVHILCPMHVLIFAQFILRFFLGFPNY